MWLIDIMSVRVVVAEVDNGGAADAAGFMARAQSRAAVLNRLVGRLQFHTEHD